MKNNYVGQISSKRSNQIKRRGTKITKKKRGKRWNGNGTVFQNSITSQGCSQVPCSVGSVINYPRDLMVGFVTSGKTHCPLSHNHSRKTSLRNRLTGSLSVTRSSLDGQEKRQDTLVGSGSCHSYRPLNLLPASNWRNQSYHCGVHPAIPLPYSTQTSQRPRAESIHLTLQLQTSRTSLGTNTCRT